eukprot:jgi/Mesvir1/19322/Mv10385-RA.1
MAEEVLQALLGRVPSLCHARTTGFWRYSIKGRPYPAATHKEGAVLEGRLLCDLTEREIAVLDEFEGPDYAKEAIKATILDSPHGAAQPVGRGDVVDADIYVFVDKLAKLFGEWNYEEFRREHLPEYVKMCELFATELSKHWAETHVRDTQQ